MPLRLADVVECLLRWACPNRASSDSSASTARSHWSAVIPVKVRLPSAGAAGMPAGSMMAAMPVGPARAVCGWVPVDGV